ncbi:MAG: dipeptide epimerase [Candidatus Omnitrophota bacterium]|jgi:L-alanine-DL-glutamate epimerase-like enolase superfamily enzyme
MNKNKLYISNFSVSTLRKELICPFRTSLGEHRNLENILFTLKIENGMRGYGEAGIAPHITGETVIETAKNLKIIGKDLIGKNISDYLSISAEANEHLSRNKSAVAAIEMAILDALTKTKKIPLWKFFGNSSKKFQTDITIVISGLTETEKAVKSFYKQGFRAFKVKIGKDMDLDFKRVVAVKRIAGNSKIYLDANQGYSAKETLHFLDLLKKVNINPDLLEQPVKKDDWEGLRKITKLSKVLVCADESVRTVADCKKAIKEKAVSVINIKTMKSGFIQAREISLLAKKAGLGLMIGGMLESSLAMTASAHLAAGLGGFKYIDLDTPFFLKEGTKNPYLSSRGIYNLSKVKAGIGIAPK